MRGERVLFSKKKGRGRRNAGYNLNITDGY